ncbi:hypothetical protein Q4577_19070 [Marinovum sp. 2_MG-2023]|uniref:beta strand repeat-containing protein n=1 Tax=unclassified Marinovum TaxID=2647166 RepID=UPI0026E21336|nr:MULTISPECIES: nidogen-like domain-containing protein [unclassified Marinovum]MDO6732141.1 hypothetical protein [Marinovum sp. 2_MG-2023]MDO6781457.1 hypothetical protein [Marinovum sp. 1_MG-2023]
MSGPNSLDPVTDNTLLPYTEADGGTLIAQGDDNSELFSISSVFENGFLFGGRTFDELFVSTNGGVTFVDQTLNFFGTFENTDFVIAPFFDDLDNRTLPPSATAGIYFSTNDSRDSVVVTWDGVGIFSNNVTAPNTFQLEIIDLENGDARVIFRYEDMGSSRGNTFQMGLVGDGGPRLFLRGGTAGDELGPAADMDTQIGNTGVAGVWSFDIIDGELQIDDLIGNTETGNSNPNTINGTDRNDVLRGGGGNDTINGRLGIDRLFGDNGNDEINGEEDDDILHGGDGVDTLNGGTGDDTLFGDAGDDELRGDSGINELDGGEGADDLIGTGGTSFASYGSSSAGLTVNLNNATLNTGDAVGDTYTNIRNLIGSEFDDELTGDNQDNIIMGGEGRDAIDGDDGDDALFGGGGDDTITGGDNDDTLAGGAGGDVLIGGPGRDAASYSDTDDGIVVDLANTALNTGDAAGDSYSGIADLIGGTGDDTLAGNNSDNQIDGLDGADLLIGRDGDDTLNGDNGDDTLNGGLGGDDLDGGRGTDAASYEDATAGVFANLANSATNTGEADGDTYNNIENLIGSGFDDTLAGNGSDNLLIGGDGDDRLVGNGGDDTLQGGAGADELSGGGNIDTADYSSASSGVSASLFDSSGNTGDARGDTYNSIENLIGTAFNDTLGDDAGDNMIMAGDGNDLINSRGGSDFFVGGEGEDTVSYADSGFVVVDLEDSTANGGAATGAVFAGIQHLVGSNQADDLFGDGENNSILGGGNNDNLNGRDGDDTLDGGTGNDTLTLGSGADSVVVRLGMGNDTVTDFDLSEDSLDLSALSAAEQDAITVSANGAGDRVLTLSDGSTLTMDGIPENSAPTGAANISGTTTQGETLTAETGTIQDLDGLGAFSFQWLRDGVAVSGETASTYQLGQDDVGAEITVTVSYTDGFNAEEQLTSAPTAAVQNVNDGPTGAAAISGTATQGETLTAETGTIQDPDGLGTFSFQWLRNGVAVSGETASTYQLGQDDVGAEITVTVSYTDGSNADEQLTSAPTAAVQNANDAPTGAATISGTATQGETLTAETGTIQDLDGLGAFSFQWLRDGVAVSGETASTYQLGQDDVGAEITVSVSYTDGFNADEQLTSAPTAAVQNVNDAPTGAVTVDGTLDPGDVLTANTSAVQDLDGLGTFSFQWLRDGVAISGETGATYTTTNADGETSVSVSIQYTDGGNTVESLTSAGVSIAAPSNIPTTGPDDLIGTVGDDNVDLLNGADRFVGLEGDDTVLGRGGDDTINGNEGNDSLTGDGNNDSLSGEAGNDTLRGGVGEDTLLGGDGNDLAFGGGQADRIFGHGGNDTLNGNGGNDGIFGGNGLDVINGQDGNDILGGGGGSDTLRGGNGDDNIGGGTQNDRLFGEGNNDTLRGEGGNDSLFGGNGNDLLQGQIGNDTLNGGNGSDTLRGGTGQDTLNGGNQNDRVFGEGGNDTVLGGEGNDTLGGGNGGDILRGQAGNDNLTGGAGNDTIHGGFGDDTMIGGQGADTFIFNATDGNDVIRDFQDDIDSIQLGNNNFSLSVNNGNAVLTFTSGSTLTIEGNFANTAEAQSVLGDDFL